MFKDIYRYNSVDVAFYIVAYANAHKVSINLTKTQKLLYIAYGANFVIGGDRLCNEHPKAWPYGPVFPTTRKKLLKAGNLEAIDFSHEQLKEVKEDSYLDKLVKFVFKGFGEQTANQLIAWTHKEDSPWQQVQCVPDFKWGVDIPDDFIAEYFKKIIIREEA